MRKCKNSSTYITKAKEPSVVCAIALEGSPVARDSAQFSGTGTFGNADKFRGDI